MKKKVVVLFGGTGRESEISKKSSEYICKNLIAINCEVFKVEIKENVWIYDNKKVTIGPDGYVFEELGNINIDYTIPCLHGFPGETGHIPAMLELYQQSFMGCGLEASAITFNKVSTKLWLEKFGIKTVPFILVQKNSFQKSDVEKFYATHGPLFVKPNAEGSSFGCFPLNSPQEISSVLEKAFGYSEDILIEKRLIARELEVACFNYKGEVCASGPGEIVVSPNSFYTFDEKYSSESKARVLNQAENLNSDEHKFLIETACQVYKVLRLKDLSRIDFFMTEQKEIYVNEVNSFPGMTQISLFPKLLELKGILFADYLKALIY
jgi:D-alanine-D-alanine ligase